MTFENAEAAFQALKFKDNAHEFEKLDGAAAFKLKRSLAGREDWTYGGFGNNWLGMWHVLHKKFEPGSDLALKLLKTGDAFLLEHNEKHGRDKVWSDNLDGSGQNWLGLQLMLIRDELQERSVASVSSARSDEVKPAFWTFCWMTHLLFVYLQNS